MNLIMSDLRVRNYEWPSFEGDSISKAKNSLLYIEQLASMTKRDISGLDMSIFLREDGKGLVSDRNKINKIFFATPNVSVQVDQIPELLKQDLISGRIPIQTTHKATLLNRIARERREASEATRRVEERLLAIKKISDELENLSDETAMRDRFVSDLNKVLSMGFFQYHAHEGSEIVFKTRPVTLRHYNKLHQVDVVVPLGSFKVHLKSSDFLIYLATGDEQYASDNSNTWHRFVPASSNIRIGDFFHPHIGSGGSVCWGQINVAAIMERRDLGALMMALEHVLTNYNHESPYVTLPDFKRRLDAIIAFKKGEHSGTEEEENDDEYCGQCDNHYEECVCNLEPDDPY